MKQIAISVENNLGSKDVRYLRRLAREFEGHFGVAFNENGVTRLVFFFGKSVSRRQMAEFENRAIMYLDMLELNYA